jgi:hypothetical protein
MNGIQFLVDEKGKKTAVLIDLKKHGELWEYFYDNVVCEQRKNEPRVSWETVKRRLRKAGKLRD